MHSLRTRAKSQVSMYFDAAPREVGRVHAGEPREISAVDQRDLCALAGERRRH